jgi:hypothetical protein
MAALEAMPAQLRRRAKSNRRGRGRPSTTEAVDFAVAALVELWCEYRADPPTTDVKRGTFGAMAVDVLTSAPVGFHESTVRAAMARVLKEPGRFASRKVAAKLKQAEPEEDEEAPPSTLIVVVDPTDQVGVQAALAYAEDGCRVVLVKAGSKKGQDDRRPLPGVETIDAAPLPATKKLLGALARHGARFDTVIVAGLGAKPGDGRVGRRGGLPTIASSALAEHAVRRPAGLACLLGELRQQKLLRRGARVVALVSAHGVIAQDPHEDRHLARTAMRALAGTIMDISIDVPSSEWVVALVSEGWGLQDDQPNRHRYPANTAAALRDTIGRLREEHHGLSLELTGGKLPSLY